MIFRNFTLDKFQEDAIAIIQKSASVIVSAPTGSGKTLIADYLIDKSLNEGKKVIYTSPIKALSNQKYKDFCELHGEEKIGLITGDLVINKTADILIMTTEVYRNMAIIKDKSLGEVSYCIMDEIHYISDIERGHIWEESIIFSPDHIRYLFLSATIPNAKEFARWVSKIKSHEVSVIESKNRPVPLKISFYDEELGITSLKKIEEKKELDSYPQYNNLFSRHSHYKRPFIPKPEYQNLVKELKEQSMLPCLFFVFSRIKTQDFAYRLSKKESFLSIKEKAEMAKIGEDFNRMSNDIKSLKSAFMLRECLSKGIAFHHAGLLPELKHLVEKLFAKGLIKVLFTTETFAVGINMPAKTVCFDSLRKYTSEGFRYLNSKEFFQIAGRAGRRGMDEMGWAIAMVHRQSAELSIIEQFTKEDTLPIHSQFKLSFNTVLNMLNLHTPDQIEKILRMNFFTFQELKGKTDEKYFVKSIKARYDNCIKILSNMGYIKEGELTELGYFTTKIFADELEISQLFFSDIPLDEYSVLLILSSIVFEEKKEMQINPIQTKRQKEVEKQIHNHPFLKKGKWLNNIETVNSIIEPLFSQKKFIDIIKSTGLQEGDLMRIFLQVLDRLEQIDRGIMDDKKSSIVRNCKYMIKNSMEGIQLF